MPQATACEQCDYFEFDEEYGEEVCQIELDMDDAERRAAFSRWECPYFRPRDDYRLARRQ